MKTFLLSLVVASSVHAGIAYNTATFPFDGKFVYGKCEPYAINLLQSLHSVHAEAYLVRYRWTANNRCGYHCLVLFKDGTKWFAVDNETWRPKWIAEQPNLKDMIREFQPSVDDLVIVRVTY